MSTNTGITVFKTVTIENFGGIDESNPMVIVFPEGYEGATVLTGDQETGKTSTLVCIESLMGGIYQDYYINKKNNSINGVFEFEVDGVKYRTKLTKTQFKLEQFIDVGGKQKWIGTGEDKTLIRRLLPFATSPDVLVQKDGTQQIKWLKDVAGSLVDESELTERHKKTYADRTAKNREVKIYKDQLIDSGRFIPDGGDVIPTEDFELKKTETDGIDFDKIIEFQEAGIKTLSVEADRINRARIKLESLDGLVLEKKKQIADWLIQIEGLEKSINDNEAEIKELEAKKIEGNKFIDESKAVVEKIDKANKELENTKILKSEKSSVDATVKLYETYKARFDEANLLTNQLDELNEQKLALAKQFTPDIEGFEVELGNLDREKGLYLNGINIAVLSESERYGLCIKIWDHFKIKVVFIENITSLGSSAMDIIKMFMANGGKVFCTQMKRHQEKISVTFSLSE